VRHDGFSDAFDVGLRPGVELNLRQCGMFGSRFRESAREERVTAVRPNPSRQLAVEMIAGCCCSASGGVPGGSIGPAATDQAARNLSRRGLIP
jgi:hypothetical protein